MEHTLRTGLTAETLPGPIRIDLDGCLTQSSVKDLLAILRRGASFQGCPDLVIDLRKVDHLEPSALKEVESFTTGHNARGGGPKVSIDLPPRGTDSAAQGTPRCGAVVVTLDSDTSAEPAARAEVPTTVADLMGPIGPLIGITQSLRQAADLTGQGHDALAVVGLNDTVAGFLSAEDLVAAAQSYPTGWQKKRCASLMQPCESRLRPDHPIEGVIQQYREDGAHSLMVFNGETPVGLLHPAEVRQWCRDYGPLPLEDLIHKPASDLTEPPDLAEPPGSGGRVRQRREGLREA